MPNLDVCGTIYPYPNVGDNPWGVPHIDWATAVSSCLTSLNTQVNTQTMPNPFTTAGDMLYENTALVPTRLAVGANGTILTVVGGLPSWQVPAVGITTIPIGGIIAWNDFNGVLLLDVNYRYCDGTVISAAGSPIDGLATDDLSGAYIVGYGTLGSGNIGTIPYDATPTGNANHQINIAHTHTHSHSHPGPSHSHAPGSLSFLFGAVDSTGGLRLYGAGGALYNVLRYTGGDTSGGSSLRIGSSVNATTINLFTYLGTGTTASGGTGNTGAASTSNTSSSLSSTQSIQPRSQRYRMIIRVL